jgi:hypothetical protein
MATTKTRERSTKTSRQSTRAANDNVDAAAERIRDLNERIIESSRKAGGVYLDIYEKTLNSIADYQEKLGEESPVDWVATIANAQANFTRDLAGAYSSAARSLLK